MERNSNNSRGVSKSNLILLKPKKQVDLFRIEGTDSFVFSPSNPNYSMALLPLMSQKAANQDPNKFKKLRTTFKKPPNASDNSQQSKFNYIQFDDTYKPTLYQKFTTYMQYLDDIDQPITNSKSNDFTLPSTTQILESVYQDKLLIRRQQSQLEREKQKKVQGFDKSRIKRTVIAQSLTREPMIFTEIENPLSEKANSSTEETDLPILNLRPLKELIKDISISDSKRLSAFQSKKDQKNSRSVTRQKFQSSDDYLNNYCNRISNLNDQVAKYLQIMKNDKISCRKQSPEDQKVQQRLDQLKSQIYPQGQNFGQQLKKLHSQSLYN